jgi:hypothetical protein
LLADPADSLRTVVQRISARSTFAFRVAANVGAQQITGTGRAKAGPAPASTLEVLTGDGTSLPVRVLGDLAYVRVPATYRDRVGKAWVSVSLTDPPTDTGVSGLAELTRFLQEFDPVRQATALLDAGTVKAVGEETVGGVRAVHYRGLVPVAELVKGADPKIQSSLSGQLRLEGVTVVPLDLWVDAGYVPRRTRWKAGTASGTADYSAWGTTVTVTRPPADQTVPLAAVLPVFTAGN